MSRNFWSSHITRLFFTSVSLPGILTFVFGLFLVSYNFLHLFTTFLLSRCVSLFPALPVELLISVCLLPPRFLCSLWKDKDLRQNLSDFLYTLYKKTRTSFLLSVNRPAAPDL